jgi:hypothetical protein
VTEALRWSSIPTSTPPALLAAAPASPALAWVGLDRAVFWQPTPASAPVGVVRLDASPIAVALSATGEHLAWLTREGAGWTSPPAGGHRRIAAAAGHGAIAFAGGHLLCAPAHATGDALLVSTRSGEARPISLARLDLAGIAGALRDHGLGEATEAAALWIAIVAGLPDAAEVVHGETGSRRRPLAASLGGSGISSGALLVHLAGGHLVRLRFRDGGWQRTELQPAHRQRLAEGHHACLHPDGSSVAALLDGGGAVVFGAGGDVLATWRVRPPGSPLAFRADGCLATASADGGLDLWRIPGLAGDVHGSGPAMTCAAAHLASFALRCSLPAERPVAPSIHLLVRLWGIGIYPPLVWVHDLLALLDGAAVGLPPGADRERAPEGYLQGLRRLAAGDGLLRVRGMRPGPPARETAVARLLGASAKTARMEGWRPPANEFDQVRDALLRSAGQGGALDPETLLPPGTVEAWEKALDNLDLDELRTLDALGDAALGLPGCLADGIPLDVLPDATRAVLNAALRLLPRVVPGRRRGGAAAVAGSGGYGEIARKGNLDNLLSTEHAYPRQLLWARLLQGEALHYGRETAPPSFHEATWLVIDAGAAMTGDPLLLARAVGVAAARLARRHLEFRFFDTVLGPAAPIERPGDVWQLIHGPPRLPANGGSAGTAGVWQGLLRHLQARAGGDVRVHLVVVSHEFLGAEEPDVVVEGLGEIARQADLRLVLMQFPDARHGFEPHDGASGSGPWLARGPSLVPERPPWKILHERGVAAALVPVTRLWETDD